MEARLTDIRKMPILPVDAYTSQEWFDREQRRIFSRTWAFAGFVEDIAEPGQYLSVQAGLNNIFIVMGRERRLRAFHNICRHRGTQLLRTAGRTHKAITCPYHDWTYDLEGRLISVPDQETQFPQLDKSCLSLKAASVETWRGCLWVHPDPDAGSIMDWFGDVEPHLGPHDFDELVEYPDAATCYDVRANWKIVVENYIDVYHLSHLHSGTLAMYDHANAEFGFVGPHFAFREPLAEDYASNIEDNSPAPLILPKDRLGTWVPMLFPGIGFAESESSWSTFIVKPVAPDMTRVENRVRVKNTSDRDFLRQEWRSVSYWNRKVKGKYAAESGLETGDPMTGGDFTAEDVFACEQQQKSLLSPHFEHGPSSIEGEKPVRTHQEIVMAWLDE